MHSLRITYLCGFEMAGSLDITGKFAFFICTHHARLHAIHRVLRICLAFQFFPCIVKKKRAFKHVKRSAFQIRLGTKKAAFPPLCAFAVTRNAPILYFIYLFYFNIRKTLSFRDSPGLSRFIPAYPVQYPFMTYILPCYNPGEMLRREFFVTTCALFVTSFIQPKMQKPGLFMQTGFSSFMQFFGSLEHQTASSVSPFSPGVLSSVWA